jgi:hypothetical protein
MSAHEFWGSMRSICDAAGLYESKRMYMDWREMYNEV